jgi:uncharacterized membrane protein
MPSNLARLKREPMKEILLVFGSVVAIVLGVVLLYLNIFQGNTSQSGYIVGDGFGIVLFSAGITGIWAVWRFRR